MSTTHNSEETHVLPEGATAAQECREDSDGARQTQQTAGVKEELHKVGDALILQYQDVGAHCRHGDACQLKQCQAENDCPCCSRSELPTAVMAMPTNWNSAMQEMAVLVVLGQRELPTAVVEMPANWNSARHEMTVLVVLGQRELPTGTMVMPANWNSAGQKMTVLVVQGQAELTPVPKRKVYLPILCLPSFVTYTSYNCCCIIIDYLHFYF